MNRQKPVSRPIYSFVPSNIEGFDSLAELALDMRWSWNHASDDLWRQLDPELLETTHNPWVVLQTVSRDRVELMLGDPVFRNSLEGLVQAKRQDTCSIPRRSSLALRADLRPTKDRTCCCTTRNACCAC